MTTHDLMQVIALGIAAGTAAFTIAKTKITQPLRSWVTNRSEWLGNLIACPYCLSHWLVAVGIAIYRPRFMGLHWIPDLGVSWLVSIFVAAITFGVIVRQIKALV